MREREIQIDRKRERKKDWERVRKRERKMQEVRKIERGEKKDYKKYWEKVNWPTDRQRVREKTTQTERAREIQIDRNREW